MMTRLLLIALLAGTCRADVVDCIRAGNEFTYVDLGVYTLTEPLRLSSNQIIWCEPGAEFVAAPGAFKGVFDSLMVIDGTKVEVHNCSFKMLRDTYTEENGYPVSEFRACVHLVGASRVKLVDVAASDCGGDGLLASPFVDGPHTENRRPCTDITVERFTSTRAYRTGVAVISAVNFTIRDSLMQDTVGVATGAAFIAEPSHAGDRASEILVERCVSKNNAGSGFRANMDRQTRTSKPISIAFKDCTAHELYEGHSICMVNQYERPMHPNKPKGYICWMDSCWRNE